MKYARLCFALLLAALVMFANPRPAREECPTTTTTSPTPNPYDRCRAVVYQP